MRDINTGVLQGDTLAQFLFIIVLENAMRTALNDKETDLRFTLLYWYNRGHTTKINSDLSYADEIIPISEEIENTQE